MCTSAPSDSSPSPSSSDPRIPGPRQTAALNLETLIAASEACAYDVTALAAHLGVSVRHLQRLFARHLQCAPRAWLREQRLQAARRLLLGAPASVKEVALKLSFRHPSQFCRDFRVRFGCTPAELKRSALDAGVAPMLQWTPPPASCLPACPGSNGAPHVD